MKRGITLFLALAIVLLSCATALAGPNDLHFLGETEEGYYEEQIENGIARVGDAIYFHGYNSIFSWKPGDTKLTLVYGPGLESEARAEQADGAEPAATAEPADGAEPAATAEPAEGAEPAQTTDPAEGAEPAATAEPADVAEPAQTKDPAGDEPAGDQPDAQENVQRSLFLMLDIDGAPGTVDLESGKVYTIVDKELVETEYRFDIDTLPGSTGELYMDKQLIRSGVYVDGKIYMACYPSDAQWGETTLSVCDLKTGQITELTDTQYRITGISKYKPGKLLISTEPNYSYNANYSEEDSYMRLRVWDIAANAYDSDTCMPFEGYNANSVVYDEDSDMIYFLQSNRVMGLKWGEEAQVVSYLSQENYSDTKVAVVGEYIAIANWQGIDIRSTDPSNLPKSILKVSGDYGNEITVKFLAEHPDVAIDFQDSSMYNIEGVTAQMAADNAPDIFVYDSYGNIGALIDKGYAADLSEYAQLMDIAGKLYPAIQEVIMRDGKLYGYPRWFSSGLWTYEPGALKEVGLGEFPETMSEFLDMVALWERDYQEDYPEKKLLDFYDDPKTMLLNLVLNQYVAMVSKPDEPIPFNTPEFREVIEVLDKLPMDFKPREDDYARGMMVEYVEPMIETYGYMENLEYYQNRKVLICPPKFTKDSEPFASGSVSMYAVNPNSKNKDLAVEYILFMAENARAAERYAMRPDLNEPVENAYFERQKKEMEAYLEELKNTEVEPENKRDHEAMIADYERYVSDMDKYRWELSESSIKNYREVAPYIRVQSSNELYNSDFSQELWKIMQRYQEGQLSAEQMVRELDQKAQMIFLETR